MKLCKTSSIFYWHVLPFVVDELLCAVSNENPLDINDFVGEIKYSVNWFFVIFTVFWIKALVKYINKKFYA
jgi:p-aminobenzoyl-glutamate transporter AbgT